MSATKGSSRQLSCKKDSGMRYSTRNGKGESLERGKHQNCKEKKSTKACECKAKTETNNSSKNAPNSKLAMKKSSTKACIPKETKKKSTTSNHKEKVVIVSKRSSSVSVVKSSNLRKSVSVRKVSYSTSVVLSSDEDSDSEDESEEEEKKGREYSKRRRTVLKHTTSKVKSNVSESKRTGTRSAQKAKAIKLLCEKLSSNTSKHKALSPSRELRPRFPYNMLQEWPAARTHRMASLNALAKVHVLYENEGRTVGESLNDADECSLIDFLNENSDLDDDVEIKKETKPVINSSLKKNDKTKTIEADKLKNSKKEKAAAIKPKIKRRGKKRKLPDVEIIDTKICKRMASLNAQAILAASYLQEPKVKRISKKNNKNGSEEKGILSTEFDLTIVKTEKIDEEEEIQIQESQKVDKAKQFKDSEQKGNDSVPNKKILKQSDVSTKKKDKSLESEITVISNRPKPVVSPSENCSVENSIVSSTAATKVGVTQYTEVTKVHVNTHNNSEVKEESKAERKIERIFQNDDVAITQLYHYQSQSANESYCVQMQTTYKPGLKNRASAKPHETVPPYINKPILPNSQNYYGHNTMIPPQSYHLNPALGPVSSVGTEHGISRQYGTSAFSVPHYRHPHPLQFPHNEYGYYQPAGPLIQPGHDQSVIHKPVPYHPQPNPHQAPQRPQQPANREGFQTFESHQHKASLPVKSPSQPPQQKPVASNAPLRSESHSQGAEQSSQYPQKPHEDSRPRVLSHGNTSSFSQPPKHVRSPVMPTLHSSQQNLRTYQAQKRVTSTYRNYNQTYDQKDSDTGNKLSSGINSLDKNPHFQPHVNQTEPKEVHSKTTSLPRDQYENISQGPSFRTSAFGFKPPQPHSSTSNVYNPGIPPALHCGTNTSSTHIPPSSSASSSYNINASSNAYNSETYSHHRGSDSSSSSNISGSSLNMPHSGFMPFHNSSGKGDQPPNFLEHSRYPIKPPPVIDITGDPPRDTKTYIQLEVPKNSHREKIVVVDVEDDDLEKKHVQPKFTDKPASKHSQRDVMQKEQCKIPVTKPCTSVEVKTCAVVEEVKPIEEVKPKESFENLEIVKSVPMEHTVKKEKIVETISDIPKSSLSDQEIAKTTDIPSPDVMVIEVKKKKESAVVRRARLHGKQRTFRDCYNRPLVPLSKSKKTEDIPIIDEKNLSKSFQPLVSLPRLVLPILEKKPLHGWSWEGASCDKEVYLSNDDPPCIRRCYSSIKHAEGDIINVRDCVFLRSGSKKSDLPFVAKITALWENPSDGQMIMSLLWYYRPEHTETDKKFSYMEDEIFASKHKDTNSVACIEDKCYVLTYSEYCRYRRRCKMIEDSSTCPVSVVPQGGEYPRKHHLPSPSVSPDLVLFCRKVYDYRQKRLLKNPV